MKGIELLSFGEFCVSACVSYMKEFDLCANDGCFPLALFHYSDGLRVMPMVRANKLKLFVYGIFLEEI